jgi:uncharacterized coiled-coil protein SlyX
MERSVEARLLMLEKQMTFNASVGEKVDQTLSQFSTRLRRIGALVESLDKGHFDHSASVDRQIAGLESLMGGVGHQVRRVDEVVTDIETKVDQLVTLSKPPRID